MLKSAGALLILFLTERLNEIFKSGSYQIRGPELSLCPYTRKETLGLQITTEGFRY